MTYRWLVRLMQIVNESANQHEVDDMKLIMEIFYVKNRIKELLRE